MKEAQSQHAVARFPLDGKRIKSIVNACMTKKFYSQAKAKYIALKPECGMARYLSVDRKPLVVVRARLRMGVALTPRWRGLYGTPVIALQQICGRQACLCEQSSNSLHSSDAYGASSARAEAARASKSISSRRACLFQEASCGLPSYYGAIPHGN